MIRKTTGEGARRPHPWYRVAWDARRNPITRECNVIWYPNLIHYVMGYGRLLWLMLRYKCWSTTKVPWRHRLHMRSMQLGYDPNWGPQ